MGGVLKTDLREALQAFSDVPALHVVEQQKFVEGYADGLKLSLDDLGTIFDPIQSQIDLNVIPFASLALAPRAIGALFGKMYLAADAASSEDLQQYCFDFVELTTYALRHRPSFFAYFSSAQLYHFAVILNCANEASGSSVIASYLSTFPPSLQERFRVAEKPRDASFDLKQHFRTQCLRESIDQSLLSTTFSELPELPSVAMHYLLQLLGSPLDEVEAPPDWLFSNQTVCPKLVLKVLTQLKATVNCEEEQVESQVWRCVEMLVNCKNLGNALFLLTDGQLKLLSDILRTAADCAVKQGQDDTYSKLSHAYRRVDGVPKVATIRDYYKRSPQ